ncbi:5999_t:CDS:2 [Funneliformis caledonium]|uniref:5999_t:CDS:1 n=1 Tax=Funneliformis caledonium TaxID=1117310 RepID=A0A9N9AL10_9GLOM|nr:5999_t:CDS:2 [Funneliformis caledonium]
MKIIKKLNLFLVIAIVVFITFASSLPNRKRDDILKESKDKNQLSLIKRQNGCPAGTYPRKNGCCCDNTCGPNPVEIIC